MGLEIKKYIQSEENVQHAHRQPYKTPYAFDRRFFLQTLGISLVTFSALQMLEAAVDTIPSANELASRLLRDLQIRGSVIDVINADVAIHPGLVHSTAPTAGLKGIDLAAKGESTFVSKPIRYRISYIGDNYEPRPEDYLVHVRPGGGLMFYPFSADAQQYIRPALGGNISASSIIQATVQEFTPSVNRSGEPTQPIIMCTSPSKQYAFQIGVLLKGVKS